MSARWTRLFPFNCFFNFSIQTYFSDIINMEIKRKLSLSLFCLFFLSVNCEILELESLEDLKNLILNNDAVSVFFYSHLLPSTTSVKSKYNIFLLWLSIWCLHLVKYESYTLRQHFRNTSILYFFFQVELFL